MINEHFIETLRRTSHESRESAKQSRMEILSVQLETIRKNALEEANRGLNRLVIPMASNYYSKYPELIEALKAEGFNVRTYKWDLTISW